MVSLFYFSPDHLLVHTGKKVHCLEYPEIQ